MSPLPPTYRLSPKNQVTLPRESQIVAGGPSHLRALPHWMPGRAAPGVRHPVVLLMTEADLRRRERKIIDSPELTPIQKQNLVMELNAGAVQLAVDEQHRVVIPAHQVEYLALGRDALFVSTGDLIYLWNPAEFQRWRDVDSAPDTPDLSAFILV
jgi:DNA-binding transcriptional regulator/RsmH inhibitor MraZ